VTYLFALYARRTCIHHARSPSTLL
jgi:hypothetical protein